MVGGCLKSEVLYRLVIHLSVIVCTTVSGFGALLTENPELAGVCFGVLGVYASTVMVVQANGKSKENEDMLG